MPNKSDPGQNPTQPINQPSDQPVAPPIASIQADLPPLPPDFQNVTPDDSTAPLIPQPSGESTSPPPSSTSPPDLPPVVSTKPKKKFAGGRVIATILGILLLIGGVGAGIFLTQQKQLFEQKATYNDTREGCIAAGNTPIECSGLPLYCDLYDCENDNNNCGYMGTQCGNGEDCDGGACVPNPITDTCGRDQDTGAPVCCTRECPAANRVCEGANRLECNIDGQHCTIDVDGCTDQPPIEPPEGTPQPPGGTPTPGSTPTPPPGAAQCAAVLAYRTISDVQSLTPAELSALSAGDVIHFCVGGNGGGLPFDKARFEVNGTLLPETTTLKPNGSSSLGMERFCQEYTIGPTVTAVSVKASIHHTVAGWVGELIIP